MNRSELLDKALSALGVLAVIVLVGGVIALITLTHTWTPALRLAGFDITELVRVPYSQCEEIRERMDPGEYTVSCKPGSPDKEFIADLIRRCAEDFSGEFVVLAEDGKLYTENLCETEKDRKDAAKLQSKKISDEDAEAFMAVYTAVPDGATE